MLDLFQLAGGHLPGQPVLALHQAGDHHGGNRIAGGVPAAQPRACTRTAISPVCSPMNGIPPSSSAPDICLVKCQSRNPFRGRSGGRCSILPAHGVLVLLLRHALCRAAIINAVFLVVSAIIGASFSLMTAAASPMDCSGTFLLPGIWRYSSGVRTSGRIRAPRSSAGRAAWDLRFSFVIWTTGIVSSALLSFA